MLIGCVMRNGDDECVLSLCVESVGVVSRSERVRGCVGLCGVWGSHPSGNRWVALVDQRVVGMLAA